MKLEQTDVSQAFDQAALEQEGYQHYLIYFLSRVETGDVKELDVNDLKEDMVEAYFFNERSQLHLFRYQGDWQAVICEAEEGDDSFDETQLLMSSDYGESMRIRHFFTFDEDGQASVQYSKLCELRVGKGDQNA